MAITAMGTVLAGLALPLAFIQLRELRQDRLRAQVSKVGAWTGTVEQIEWIDEQQADSISWAIPLLIRNGSELPVRVDAVDLVIRPWGYDRVLAAPEGTSEAGYYTDKRFGGSEQASFVPGTIAPEDTWSQEHVYKTDLALQQPQPPMVSVARVVVTDAAGYQWEMRTGKAGPARRVQRWRRWWWKRHGDL